MYKQKCHKYTEDKNKNNKAAWLGRNDEGGGKEKKTSVTYSS